MGDEAPTTLELTCPGCGAFFRLKPKRGRLPKGPIPCPKCTTSIPVPQAELGLASEASSENEFSARPQTNKSTAPMSQIMGTGIIKRKRKDPDSSGAGSISPMPRPEQTPARKELEEHSSPRLAAPDAVTALDKLFDDAPGPGSTFLGLPTLGDSGLGVKRAEFDPYDEFEPLRARRLDEGHVPESALPPTSSRSEFSREDKTIAADDALMAQLSEQRSTREVPTAQTSAIPEHMRDTKELDPIDGQDNRKTPINLERPPVDLLSPHNDDDDELGSGAPWEDAQGPFDLRDILAAEKERGNELSGEITRNPALDSGIYPAPEPHKKRSSPDDSFGADLHRPRSKHLATLSVSAKSPEEQHRETSDRSNSGAFKHARVSTGDIFSETSSALGDDSFLPMFEAKEPPKPQPPIFDDEDDLLETPRTTAEYSPVSPAKEPVKAPEPSSSSPSKDNDSFKSEERPPALSMLLKRKIGQKKVEELRSKIEPEDEPEDEPEEEQEGAGLYQDSGTSSLDALFEEQGKSKFGNPISHAASSSSPSTSAPSIAPIFDAEDLFEAVSQASEAIATEASAPTLKNTVPSQDTAPTRETLDAADIWDEFTQDEQAQEEAPTPAEQPSTPVFTQAAPPTPSPAASLSEPSLTGSNPERPKPLISALKQKLLERQQASASIAEELSSPQPEPTPAEPQEERQDQGAALDLQSPTESHPSFFDDANDRSSSSLISGFPTSSQSTDELKIIRSKRRRAGESQSGLFARPLSDGLGQESSVTMGMAGERRGSGYIRLPTTEILEVLGHGDYRLMVEDIVYEPVDEQGLLELIKQGVLLGAEQIAEADGDWTPIAEHPVFKRLRKKMALEAHAVLAKYRRKAAESSDKLSASKPQQTPPPRPAELTTTQPPRLQITKPLTPVNDLNQHSSPSIPLDPDELLDLDAPDELNDISDAHDPHIERTRERQFNTEEQALLGIAPSSVSDADEADRAEEDASAADDGLFGDDDADDLGLWGDEPQAEEAAPAPAEPESSAGGDEDGFFFDDSALTGGESVLLNEANAAKAASMPAMVPEPQVEEPAQPESTPEPEPEQEPAQEPAQEMTLEDAFASTPLPEDDEPVTAPKSPLRWLLPLLLILAVLGGGFALYSINPGLFGAGAAQPDKNNAQPKPTPQPIAAVVDAGPDHSADQGKEVAATTPDLGLEQSPLERALALEKAGDYAGAIPILEQLHAQSPKDADLIQFLARAYFGDKRFSQTRQTALLGLTQPQVKKDDAERLIKLFKDSIIFDPRLTQTQARTIKADQDFDGLHFAGDNKYFFVHALKDGKVTHTFKPAQAEWGDRWDQGWRQEVATWRLSEVLASDFEIPYTEPVRISEDDFMALFKRHDSEQQKKGLNRIVEWNELNWVSEKGEDGTKRRYLYGALQKHVEPKSLFPLKYTNVWQPLVDLSEDERELDRPLAELLEPLKRADEPQTYEQALAQLGKTTPRELGAQLSELVVLNYLINHRPPFDRKSYGYGQSTWLHEGKLHTFDHGMSWDPRRASTTIRARFRDVSRFSKKNIKALEIVEPKLIDGVLYPDANSIEKKRLKVFWDQRKRTLSQVEKLVDKYTPESVMFYP